MNDDDLVPVSTHKDTFAPTSEFIIKSHIYVILFVNWSYFMSHTYVPAGFCICMLLETSQHICLLDARNASS